MSKYSIKYTNGSKTPERNIIELVGRRYGWQIMDSQGICHYYKNGKKISLEQFALDFLKTQHGEDVYSESGIFINHIADNEITSKYDCQQIINLSGSTRIANFGSSARIANFGDNSVITSSGINPFLLNSGDNCLISNSGFGAKIISTGCDNKIISVNEDSLCDIRGEHSICINTGKRSYTKGAKGTTIVLCEWRWSAKNDWELLGSKTGIIDGKTLKENTYYGLYNGKFHEIDVTDNIKSVVLWEKGKVKKVAALHIGSNKISDKVGFIVTDGNGYFAHGLTIKEAKNNLLYKISNRDTSQYKKLTLKSEISFKDAIKMYRVITGACEFGTKHFIEQNKIKRRKYTIKEIIELTKGQWGNDKLKEFFCKGGGNK